MQPLCLTGTDFPYLVLFLSVVSLKTGAFEELVLAWVFWFVFFVFCFFVFNTSFFRTELLESLVVYTVSTY